MSVSLHNTEKEQKYLISSLQNPYLDKRGSELKIDMSDSLRQSMKNFQNAQIKNKNIEIKMHKEIVRFRIILLSHCLYLSFQEVNIPGRESPILKIDMNSSIYKCFKSLFNDLWVKYEYE